MFVDFLANCRATDRVPWHFTTSSGFKVKKKCLSHIGETKVKDDERTVYCFGALPKLFFECAGIVFRGRWDLKHVIILMEQSLIDGENMLSPSR